MTTFNEIYNRFLSKIEDYDLLESLIDEENSEAVTQELYGFLQSSIPKFTYGIDRLKDRNETSFSNELTELEKEIVSTLMVIEYLSPKILRTEFLEQRLGSKDYRLFSPANQMKEVREIRESFKREANQLMTEYYFSEKSY